MLLGCFRPTADDCTIRAGVGRIRTNTNSLSKPAKMCLCRKYTVTFMVEVSGLPGEVGVVLAYGLWRGGGVGLGRMRSGCQEVSENK